MSVFPLEKFLALVDVDRMLIKLGHQGDRLVRDIETGQRQQQTLQDELERVKLQEKEKHKAVDACELQMKELDQERKRYSEQLDAAQSDKEYRGLKGAVDRVKAAQYDLESGLLEAWKQYEAAQAETVHKIKEFEQQRANLEHVIQDKRHRIAELEAEKKAVLETRAAKETEVPEEWLERYSTMKQRVDDPVVPVESGACSACFYSVLQQDLSDLRKRKLLQCKDCFRLLYLPEFLTVAPVQS